MSNQNNQSKQEQVLVSVIFAVEGEPKHSIDAFKQIRKQNYQNVEYVFVYGKEFEIDAFKESLYSDTDLDYSIPTQFVEAEYGVSMMNEGIAVATGDILFFKSLSPTVWYPNHFSSHVKKHKESKNKNSFVLSLIEIKNMNIGLASPFATMDYRINKKIKPEEVVVDEFSITKDIPLNFKNYSSFANEQLQIVPDGTPNSREVYDSRKLMEYILRQKAQIKFTDEISMVLISNQPLNPKQEQILLTKPDWDTLRTLQTVDDDFNVVHYMPTLFGNTQLDSQWNHHVRELIKEHKESIQNRPVKRILVKRTIGMGDVIETEPVLRYLRKEYAGCEIWFATSNSRSCKDIVNLFESKPDVVLPIEENQMFQDVFGMNNLPKLLEANGYDKDTTFDLRFDLDLAYESRIGMRFIDAYFLMMGVLQNDIPEEEKTPRFIQQYESDSNVISVCLEGSGWESKELNVLEAEKILLSFAERGFKLYHTSPISDKYKSLEKLFDEVNSEGKFEKMIEMVGKSVGYIGADNGPMHCAVALNKPIFVWNGAALTDLTTAYKNKVVLVKEELKCIGCKHRMFYRIIPISQEQSSVTFLPECTNEIKYECTGSFGLDKIQNKINEFVSKLGIEVKYDKTQWSNEDLQELKKPIKIDIEQNIILNN